MSKLVLVDAQYLFYAIKRVTGDRKARVDFARLREAVGFDPASDRGVVFVSTAVFDGVKRSVRAADDAFVRRLKGLGYEVRRMFARARVEGGSGIAVDGVRTDVEMSMIYSRELAEGRRPSEVVLVSGAGRLVGLAEKVRSNWGRVTVACFVRPGDLHSDLRAAADAVVSLGRELKYEVESGKREAQEAEGSGGEDDGKWRRDRYRPSRLR